MLPDYVLLEIFGFYVDEDFRSFEKQRIEQWITLAHVCRCWRSVVYLSPRSLNLRLLCTSKTPARDTPNIWPLLPLIIRSISDTFDGGPGVDNIIAALEHNNRVCQVDLQCFSSQELGYVTDSAAMQEAFPALTDLRLGSAYGGPESTLSILPDSFLGGAAPRLRSLHLFCIPFPGLPHLLLSATHLVDLDLFNIPRSGYIPPKAMAIALSLLTSLESFRLHFRHPQPFPALESLRSDCFLQTPFVLPRLTKIRYKGVSEYLEEILAQIVAPQLNKMDITFFNDIIFETPQLFEFITRTRMLMVPKKCYITFNSEIITIRFPSQSSDYSIQVLCTVPNWQLSSLEDFCTESLPPVPALEDLYILEDSSSQLRWQDDIENKQWLELLYPFAAVKNLYVCKTFVPRIAPALQELAGEGATDCLPILKNIFLGFQPSGPLHEGIEKFVAARRLTYYPVAVFRWDRDSKH